MLQILHDSPLSLNLIDCFILNISYVGFYAEKMLTFYL